MASQQIVAADTTPAFLPNFVISWSFIAFAKFSVRGGAAELGRWAWRESLDE